jgi:hypothetical protein
LNSDGPIGPHRSFDPRAVGRLETDAWVAYYRREWLAFLRAGVRLTHDTFGLPWPATMRGAWLVLRANQQWAPFPDNDPAACRRTMGRFYRLVKERYGEAYDPVTAAALEVEWWRVHREHQHDESVPRPGPDTDELREDERPLANALAALYTHVYGVSDEHVRVAAEQRAVAMRHSDRWVRDGCALGDPLVDRVRAALTRSYAGLLAGVHRA